MRNVVWLLGIGLLLTGCDGCKKATNAMEDAGSPQAGMGSTAGTGSMMDDAGDIDTGEPDASTPDASLDDAAIAEDADVPDSASDTGVKDLDAGDDAGDASDASDADAAPPPDETAPVIDTTSLDEVVLDCADTFEPAELTAEDETDGPVDVTVEGAELVDTSVPGVFTVTYSAQDASGNVAEVTQTVHVCGPACGVLGYQPINLSPWTVIQYEQDSQADANWTRATDNLSVVQSVNADASIFLSDFDATDLAVRGVWRIGSSSDDDFVGFVFGYQDRGHFYLFDWKQGTQAYMGTEALVGMSLKIVDTESTDPALELPIDDLWPSVGSPNVTPIDVDGTVVRNSIPWQENVDYTFYLEQHAGSFRIAVYDAAGLELESWSIVDDTYTSGRFGFYNFSQGPVTYSSFLQRVTPPACSTVDPND